MRIHFIQQDPWVAPGEYLAWAIRNHWDVSVTSCWLHEDLPQEADAEALIVLGGYQCPATTKEECDYFDSAAEQALIRKYVEAGKAVIGVCLGAQLVGEALGAPYEHSPEKEIGPVKARLTAEGRADPFLKRFPDVFDAGEWHNDMPGLTPDAVILAESDGCPRQIVRYGKYVYGFQTHMEFTHDLIAAGLEDCGGEIKAEGPYVQHAKELLAYDYTEMNRLLSTFLDALLGDYAENVKNPG
jgi:GMP synthase (glutamine-hydrolysing)